MSTSAPVATSAPTIKVEDVATSIRQVFENRQEKLSRDHTPKPNERKPNDQNLSYSTIAIT
ncbi:hypothetical protein OAM67_00900 [bacterium]|nr:hypothetical protein [bacterium]